MMGPSAGVTPDGHILRGDTMQTMVAAARQVCRAWYSSEPVGGAMAALADQLALIDEGQTYGTESTRGSGWTAPEGQGLEAIGLRVGRPVQADGEAA